MARLFSKDYHDKSNSWYFNHAVILLEEGDLWYWYTKDESANVVMRFYPSINKREYFSAWVEVLYNPQEKRIISYKCAECGQEESCRHYLSLLRYAYNFISDDILKEEMVQTCDSDCLRGNIRWINATHELKLYFEGIYNLETSKIRIYHHGLEKVDVVGITKLLKGNNEVPKNVTNNISVFSQYQLAFFEFVVGFGLSYSAKHGYWSLPKSLFPILLARMEHLQGCIFVRETGEALSFASQPYSLALRIEKLGKKGYNLIPVVVDELSAWYAGYPSWLFFRNVVHKVWLPFTQIVIDDIFAHKMQIEDTDLPYYRSIVHRELALQNIYLDFDESIELPLVMDSQPQGRLYIREMGEDILIEGYWVYDEVYELPIAALKYAKPLVYSKYRGGNENDKMWFYLSPELHLKARKLLNTLPIPQINELEQNSQLVYLEKDFSELQKAVFSLDEQEWELEIDEALSRRFIAKIHLEAELRVQRHEDIDWFSYEVEYRYKDLRFSHDELAKYFRSQEEFLHTEDGRIYFIGNPGVFSEIDRLLKRSKKANDDVYRTRVLNLPYYQRLREENPAIRILGDEYIESMFEDLQARRLKRNPELPSYLHTILRGYQKAGVAWLNMLKHYHFNGILADEMGLGKTIQALAMVAANVEGGASMVICPKTLLYNWAAEIEKFHTNIPYAIVEGAKPSRVELLQNPNIKLFIISYSMVLSDFSILKTMHFDWLILDEAQNIKNVSAQRTFAIKKLNSSYRMALSGTPIENNITELWSIMDFLMPGYLGSVKSFKSKYLTQEIDRDNNASLHKLCAPFLLRRIKKEVLLELPDKQEQVSWCKMNLLQEKLYLQILDTVQRKLMPTSSETISYVHILAALTKLRQVCNHPHLANGDILPEPALSAKLEMLVELVQDSISSGHKILVFSQFVQMLKIMRKVFDKLGISYSYLDGKTKDRAKAVQDFESSKDIRLFLISLKTGGTGLNLTSADTVILYDPWWNPMVENQAIDRSHRIGQTKKVQVFRLITKATVEEKILSLQQNKIDLFNEVVEGGSGVLKTMSLEELKQLFAY
ncbi:MAG: DEAD/DEAH box helicase [Candidatus Cloacimonetes bacterium]|nr:DEAD/DEAH box helicase [Candidatus Cloacimonadota bacterium]